MLLDLIKLWTLNKQKILLFITIISNFLSSRWGRMNTPGQYLGNIPNFLESFFYLNWSTYSERRQSSKNNIFSMIIRTKQLLFQNKRLMLDEMTLRNASNFEIFWNTKIWIMEASKQYTFLQKLCSKVRAKKRRLSKWWSFMQS